jgi:hypothetical protein
LLGVYLQAQTEDKCRGIKLVATVRPLAGQTDETGILEGRVEEETGTPVAIADVGIAQADGSYPGRAVAGENGFFRTAPVELEALTVAAG